MLLNKFSQRNRLRHFVGDGIWASVCDGLAESNFNAFATALSASVSHISYLTSSQNLVGCWLQLWSEKLVKKTGSRKRMVLLCVSLQIATLATMLLSALCGVRAVLFMVLSLIFTVLGGLSGPVWSAWVSELIPSQRRGFCFGIRNQRTYPAQFVALLLGGLVLQNFSELFSGNRSTQIAFSAIFLFGMIAKSISLYHLFLQPETHSVLPSTALGPLQIVREGYEDPQLQRMILFFGVMGFSVNLSGPFQTPFLLQTLRYGYLPFASVTATLVMSRFLAAPTMGRILDRVGYQKPLLISTLLMPGIPLGWALSHNYYWILGIQVYGGFVWTAFDLSVFSFLTESTPSKKRQIAFSLKQISFNLASCGGALMGGYLMTHSKSPLIIYWASTLGRLTAILFVFRMIHFSPLSDTMNSSLKKIDISIKLFKG